MRGRPKGSTGTKQRKWTIEEKLEIVKKHVDEHISFFSLRDIYQVNPGLIHTWVKKYLENFLTKEDPNPWALTQREYIQRAIWDKKPVLGMNKKHSIFGVLICNGA